MRNLKVNKHGTFLIVLLLSIFSGANIKAQIMEPFYPILPDATTGQSYGLNFAVTGLPGGVSITHWEWSSDVPFTGPPSIGLNLNDLGVVSGNVNSAWGTCFPCTVTVTAERSDGQPDIVQTYSMVVRNPPTVTCPSTHEFALVLDASGSMNATTARGTTRWEDLTSAVIDYFPNLKTAAGGDARLKVYFFKGASADVELLFNGVFNDIDETDADEIEKELFGDGAVVTIAPGGATPMGQGILNAIAGFVDPANSQNIIVFTDGYQNQSPLFETGTQMVGTTDLTFGGTSGVKVFSIGVGGSDETMLPVLSNPDGFFAHAYDTEEMNLFFTSTLPFAFRDCSPRIVDYRFGTLAGDNETISQKFKVDSLIENLTIQLLITSPHSQVNDNHQLLKDGVIITGVNDNFTSTKIRYDIDLPLLREDSTFLDGGGVWELRFSGTEGAEYEITAIADDKYLQSGLKIGTGEKLYAGDDIAINLNLSLIDEPLEGATAKALLVRPGEDLRDLVAETFFDPDQLNPAENTIPQGLDESHLLAQTKIDTLLSNPDFLTQLGTVDRSIDLTYSNGFYRGTFSGVENAVSGTYKIVIDFEGDADGLGAYEGMETKWINLDFARPDDIDLNEQIVRLGKLDLVNYRITMQPTNQFGKKLGLGQSHRINVFVGNSKVTLVDQLDGTYEGFFSTQPDEKPMVSIRIIDPVNPVLEKPLNSFFPKFGLSLHGGYVKSRNNATPLTNSSDGNYFEVDLSYRVSQRITLQLLGGSYNFDGNFNILGVSLLGEYAILNPRSSGFFLNASVGLGGFKPESQDFTLGIGAKANFGWRLNNNLEIGADVGGFVIPDPNYQFNSVGVGLRYFF